MNASTRRYARKLARRRTRELVAVRRAVALAEGSRGISRTALPPERPAAAIPAPRTLSEPANG